MADQQLPTTSSGTSGTAVFDLLPEGNNNELSKFIVQRKLAREERAQKRTADESAHGSAVEAHDVPAKRSSSHAPPNERSGEESSQEDSPDVEDLKSDGDFSSQEAFTFSKLNHTYASSLLPVDANTSIDDETLDLGQQVEGSPRQEEAAALMPQTEAANLVVLAAPELLEDAGGRGGASSRESSPAPVPAPEPGSSSSSGVSSGTERSATPQATSSVTTPRRRHSGVPGETSMVLRSASASSRRSSSRTKNKPCNCLFCNHF